MAQPNAPVADAATQHPEVNAAKSQRNHPVDRIIGARFISTTRVVHVYGPGNGKPVIDCTETLAARVRVKYLVDWEGNFPPSWEPRGNLVGCKASVADFWAKQADQDDIVIASEVAWANS